MQVQRFRKPTVREALAEVRQVLGPDALVIATSLVPVRGWGRVTGRREVEVTASPAASLSETRPAAPSNRPAAVVTPPRAADASREPEAAARLVAAGVDANLAAEVAATLPSRARRDPSEKVLLDALAGRLGTLIAGPEPFAAIEVFVGPPGVGKTTTIAKLAAQLRARHRLRPTLVAADGYRVGAVEQLRLYAEILGLPFVVARTGADLERAIAGGGQPMLVDTAGRSPADRGVRDLFDALSGRPGVRTHLVLDAGTAARDAARVMRRYESARVDRVVLTKVDETESVAPLIGVLRDQGVRLSWVGCGQRVPEDLVRATSRLLAAAAAGEPILLPEGMCA